MLDWMADHSVMIAALNILVVSTCAVVVITVVLMRLRHLEARYDQFRAEAAETLALAFQQLDDLNVRVTAAGHPPGRVKVEERTAWSPPPAPNRR